MPQRFLRPGITDSDRWNSVSFMAQSLFIRLLTKVDDYGRYDGRASVICGHCFAVWNEKHPDSAITPQESAALSGELLAAGLVEMWETDGKKILQVTQWQERIREGAKEKWPISDKSLRNPAESCGILPPSPPSSPPPASSSSVLIDVPPARKTTSRGTKEEIVRWCLDNELPESDGAWLWNHWEGNGWKNNGKPMKSWPHTIASWKAANYLPSQKSSASKPKSYV